VDHRIDAQMFAESRLCEGDTGRCGRWRKHRIRIEETPMTAIDRRRAARIAAGTVGLLIVLALARPVVHVARTAFREREFETLVPAWGPDRVEDFSRLDATRVRAIERLPAEETAAIDMLRRLLREASKEHLRVSIAGARHSMGGQTFTPAGIVVDMLPFRAMSLDEERRVLRVQAGAKWEDVIPYLGARGLSVSIMQSDSAFTVGGSLAVNCHGWQNDRPPIASTVESFRLMLADGRIVRSSRTENKDLFSAAIGGYGLLGVILDVELRVMPDARYRIERHLVLSKDYVHALDAAVRADPVGLAFGRLNVSSRRFLQDAELTTFVTTSNAPPGEPIVELAPWAFSLERWIFRGSEGSDYGKELRWSLETNVSPWFFGRTTHRNQVARSRVESYVNRDPARTDVLQEYFVPRERLEEFLARIRAIVPSHRADLLNVTLRDVRRDDDTLLRYADADMMALVMFFSQERTRQADQAMQALTRELIDASLVTGGRYYLPYRLHATRGQFQQAYPRHEEFFARKRAVDPEDLFQNQFYRAYGPAPWQPRNPSR
jgi:FAD/FMN-containing dehydrogenase